MFKNIAVRASSVLLAASTKSSTSARCSTASINFAIQRFLSDRRYSDKHEWVVLDAADKSVGTVGISKYAQEALGDVVYVQFPDIGEQFTQHDECGTVESVKAANEIYTPVSGSVLEINKGLEDKPSLINSSCYEQGWIFKIKIQDPKEVDGLMDEDAYAKFLKSM